MTTTKPAGAAVKARFECSECGTPTPKWLGRCPECGAWDAVGEVRITSGWTRPTADVVALGSIGMASAALVPTGVGELDRVLGGGLLPGSVTLLGGEPGIGKSTLVLQMLGGMARRNRRGLLVTGEESATQVAVRAERIGASSRGVSLLAATSMAAIIDALDDQRPDVVVVDSIQTVADPELPGSPGSITQVRSCAAAFVGLAKSRDLSVVLVGHVTKDGDLAGPRALEHVVDTVVSFEGDRHHALRLLRVLKHRFGAASETGVLEMGGGGLVDVGDPSSLFLADRAPGAPGCVVVPVIDGVRPLLVEAQALVTDASSAIPRRFVQGFDASRVGLLVAVLAEHAGVRVGARDVYVSIAGGLRVAETGADLGVALALVSSVLRDPVDPSTVVVGELGLAGEVRQVSHTQRRLTEAFRLGFGRAIVPQRTPDIDGLALVRVATAAEAATAAGLVCVR